MTRLKRHNFRQREATQRKKRKIEVTQIRLSKQELNDIKCQQMLTDRHIDAAHQMLLNQFPEEELTVDYLLSHTPLNFALAIIQSATGRQKVLYNLYQYHK